MKVKARQHHPLNPLQFSGLATLLTLASLYPRTLGVAALTCACAYMVLRRGITVAPLRVMVPLVIVAFTATIVDFVSSVSVPFEMAKSVYYILRPGLFLFFGFCIARSFDERDIIAVIFTVGVALAFYYLFLYFSDPNVSTSSREYVRKAIGTGYFITWLSSAITLSLIIRNKTESNVKYVIVLTLLAAQLLSIYISTSRSGWVYLSFFAVSMTLLRYKCTALLKWCSYSIAVYWLIVFTPILEYVLGLDLSGLQLNVFPELQAPEYGDMAFINEHWRGYELGRVFQFVFIDSRGWVPLVGAGLSAQVPLGLVQNLGGTTLSEIGIFHNAYSLLVLRGGIIGVFAFLAVLVSLGRYAFFRSDKTELLHTLCMATFAFTVFAIPTTASIFNPDDLGILTMIILGISVQKVTAFSDFKVSNVRTPNGKQHRKARLEADNLNRTRLENQHNRANKKSQA